MSGPSVLIQVLDQTPAVMRHLLSQIPAERQGVRRVENQWCAKEWLGHLVDAQDVLMARFGQFESGPDPLIADYQPPTQSDTRYLDLDLDAAVARFAGVRSASIRKLQGYDDTFWDLLGRHESFSPYGTRILLNHMLNVDYAHLFGIENAGLTIAL